MRAIVIGAGNVGIMVVKRLIEWKDEVILIEKDKDIAENLADKLDCTVINGDGSDPETLKKAQVEEADVIIALTDNDQSNIIIGLMARTFADIKTMIKITKPDFIPISRKLGFDNIITPSVTASVQASYLTRGLNILELVNLVRREAKFYHLSAGENLHEKKIVDLAIPKDALLFAIYRQKDFLIPKGDVEIRKDDELVFILKETALEELKNALGVK
ncbi:MAG: NAD-binding protein [Proteobacteria bacterium]|nr:NAD-binding protein [Pseudomonadota bacterium]MBU4067799.1 NAD-binding protein [Pseudomonadota bacterium]MBU4127289.1 NAD-binding protein [Pseudomonadota bacterium]